MLITPKIEPHGRFLVVRDDIHPGGTKQIVLREWLPELNDDHFVYVASAFGKGGAALAYACAELGFRCTLFIARAPTQMQWIADVQKLPNVRVLWTEQMPVQNIEPLAWEYATHQKAQYLAPGFAQQRFIEIMAAYMRGLEISPAEIWCPVVSGTMAQALELAFPEAAVKGVSVVKHPGYQGNAQIFEAQEKFVRLAASPPLYPSWPYSDAKIWRVAQKHGADGAVIWNSNA